MRQETRSCTVHASPEVVWDFLGDYSNCIGLCSSSACAKLESGHPGQVGARYAAEVTWEGMPSRFKVTLVDAVRPDSLTWVSHTGGANGKVRFDLAPTSGGTKVTLTMALSMGGAMRPLEPFGWGLLGRFEERFIRKLRAVDPILLAATSQQTASHPST